MLKDILLLGFIILGLDYLYFNLIGKIAKDLIFKIQKSKLELNVYAAALCYIFLICLIYYFIIKKNASFKEAFLLGFLVYGIYDTTNMALLKDWSINLAIIDSLWGGLLFSLTKYFYGKIIKLI
jgi:uncharacterized membrane protein